MRLRRNLLGARCGVAVAAALKLEQAGALPRLQAFASERGPDFYGLPRNRDYITLEHTAWTPPAAYPFGQDELVPFRAGESLAWRLAEEQRA